MLQGLTFFHCILELRLDLLDPGLELFPGGLLLDSLLLGLAQGLPQGLDLGRGSCTYYDTTVNTQRPFRIHSKSLLTLLLLEPNLNLAELVLSPLQPLP